MEIKTEILKLKEKELAASTAADWIVPRQSGWSILYLYSTLIAPWIIIFLFLSNQFGLAEWQAEKFSTYLDLSFATSITTLFLPFVMYGSVSIVLLLIDQDHFRKFVLVRFGVYTGTLVAIQYSVQLLLSGYALAYLFGIFSLLGLAMIGGIIYLFGGDYDGNNSAANRMTGIVFLAAVAIIAVILSGGLLILLLMSALLAAGGMLCAPLGVWSSVRLLLLNDFERPQLIKMMGLSSGWLIAYIYSWSIAQTRILELYDQLPAHPPDCYIATASARGHHQLTGAFAGRVVNGRTIPVSRQLQCLKGGELALKVIAPRTHRRFRWVYDAIGPRLAARMTSPWLADIGYLLLKPFEWMTLTLLRLFFPELLARIKHIYVK